MEGVENGMVRMVPDLVGSPKQGVSDYLDDTVFGAYAYFHICIFGPFLSPLYTQPTALLSLPVFHLSSRFSQARELDS